jgi:hypothetical protein
MVLASAVDFAPNANIRLLLLCMRLAMCAVVCSKGDLFIQF